MAEYTLEELAELTGITARTIRSYIEKGLLPGPGSTGPKARYSDDHLEKLRTILHLRHSKRLALGDIRQLLLTLSDEALRQVRKQGQLGVEEFSDVSSALDYIRRVATEGTESPQPRRRTRAAPRQPVKAEGPVYDLLKSLRRLVGKEIKVTRRARAEGWRRIEVTPDFEIHVRGLPEPEIREIEKIADLLRTLLIGG